MNVPEKKERGKNNKCSFNTMENMEIYIAVWASSRQYLYILVFHCNGHDDDRIMDGGRMAVDSCWDKVCVHN